MFPITHIWFSRQVLGYINNLTVLGSIFPDIAVSGHLTYNQTHHMGWGLFDGMKTEGSRHMDFCKALVTHTVDPRGLDYYGDEAYGNGYKGYCFQKGVQIVEEVIEACNLPSEYGLWKAHNFIEMGIEINMIQKEQSLIKRLHDSLQDMALIAELAVPLEQYFKLQPHSIEASFSRFKGFVELKDLNSDNLAFKYNVQMQSKHGISIDVQRCSEIIEKSREIVRHDFDAFIAYSLDEVSRLLKEE